MEEEDEMKSLQGTRCGLMGLRPGKMVVRCERR